MSKSLCLLAMKEVDKRVRQVRTSKFCRADRCCEANSEQANAEDEAVSQEVQSNTQPPLNVDGHGICATLHISGCLKLGPEVLLLTISSDTGKPNQLFTKRRVDVTALVRVNALDFPRRLPVETCQDDVDEDDWYEDYAEQSVRVEN